MGAQTEGAKGHRGESRNCGQLGKRPEVESIESFCSVTKGKNVIDVNSNSHLKYFIRNQTHDTVIGRALLETKELHHTLTNF